MLHALAVFLTRAGERKARLTLDKSEFLVPSTVFLGEEISKEGHKVSASRLQGLYDIRQPESKADLRMLMGMLSFWRDFVPNFATMASSLYDLLKLDARFNWHQLPWTHWRPSNTHCCATSRSHRWTRATRSS